MTNATRRTSALVSVAAAALAIAACGGSAPAGSRAAATARLLPERIVRAPRNLVAIAQPQSNGIMWVLAGRESKGLYQIDSATNQVVGSVSVSRAVTSVAESSPGVLGLTLATNRSGAIEFLDGSTSRRIRTVPLPAPARDISVGSDGTTFYVLTSWATAASVSILNSQSGKVKGTVPVPADAVSVVPDNQQALLYVLGRDGEVTAVSISDGRIASKFRVGHESGISLTMSPDGSTLYVLKGTDQMANVAVVSVATQGVQRVLPAPSHCVEVLTSVSGGQLYEVAGTRGFGNIQVFAA
ncbi:MAG TPA: hypothetical protein VNF47_06370 [Streptosporangiaceae bacterium]|nr:hypothetical protein [Streptosporangiaceae bacterium]